MTRFIIISDETERPHSMVSYSSRELAMAHCPDEGFRVEQAEVRGPGDTPSSDRLEIIFTRREETS